MKRVVVIGGGFAGLHAVQGLAKVDCEITLIDRTNHTLFTPLLYQVATAALNEDDIATPLRKVLRHRTRGIKLTFRKDRAPPSPKPPATRC